MKQPAATSFSVSNSISFVASKLALTNQVAARFLIVVDEDAGIEALYTKAQTALHVARGVRTVRAAKPGRCSRNCRGMVCKGPSRK